MTPSCRNCSHAYCRVEETKDWNYEACGIGAHPMVMNLPGNTACRLHEFATPEKLAIVLEPRNTLIWGEDIELEL